MYEELVKSLRICGDSVDAIDECCYEDCIFHERPINPLCMQVLCNKAAVAIEELSKTRWIPVTERLPEDSGYYIVCAKDGTRTHVSFVKYQYRYKSWLLNGARAYWIITHWMPLPEPPKEVPGHE